MSIPRIAVALAVLSTLLFAIHYYLWARLVRDPALPPPWSALLTWALVILGASGLGGFLLARLAPRGVSSPVMWVVYTWLGFMFFLFVLLVLGDLARGLGSLVQWATRGGTAVPGEGAQQRRDALARILAGLVSFFALGLGGVSLANGLGQVGIKRVKVSLPRLPAGAPPYKLVQLSDIHVGPTIVHRGPRGAGQRPRGGRDRDYRRPGRWQREGAR